MHQYEESQFEEGEATKAIERVRDMFPVSKSPEVKNFKPQGINFNRRSRRKRFFR